MPAGGRWREALNTDSAFYGGSGVGNLGAVEAEPMPWNDQPFSVARDAAAARGGLAYSGVARQPSHASFSPTTPTKTANTIFSVDAGRASASFAPANGPDRSDEAEAQGEPEVSDAAAAQGEAADDRGREDDEQRRRLGSVLGETDGEHEERNHERSAADAEQPRRDPARRRTR